MVVILHEALAAGPGWWWTTQVFARWETTRGGHYHEIDYKDLEDKTC